MEANGDDDELRKNPTLQRRRRISLSSSSSSSSSVNVPEHDEGLCFGRRIWRKKKSDRSEKRARLGLGGSSSRESSRFQRHSCSCCSLSLSSKLAFEETLPGLETLRLE
ncbi:hypothetical protein Bca52824_025596 [Brassica carinata]|uniref:Uncharacterized protein n=1 Tax=Brassica carinata TaxID=52824 RepID=A0A8X7SGI8_BRACI|nr:hypothetical protein Bca52824_025596 [Brassica carinata]